MKVPMEKGLINIPAEKTPFWELYDLIYKSVPEGGRFIEIGTWFGHSAIYMARKLRDGEKSFNFHCVDTFEGSYSGSRIQNTILEQYGGCVYDRFIDNMMTAGVRDNIGVVYKEPSLKASCHFADQSIDAVFIDAGHDTPEVLSDCLAWWPKLKSGGIFSGDDWQKGTVREGIRLFQQAMPVCPDPQFFPVDRPRGWWIRKP